MSTGSDAMEANRMTALTNDTGATAAASRDPSADQCQGCALEAHV